MNRRGLLRSFLTYLGFLVFISLCLTGLLLVKPSASKTLIFALFLLLFLGGIFGMVRWIDGLKVSLSALNHALENLGVFRWDIPLPSSEIEEIWGFTLTFHETRRRLREKILSLEGEKEKLDRLLSNMKEGILVSDAGNRIVVANESAENLLKIKKEDLIGKSLDLLLTGEYKPIFETLIHGEEKTETLFVNDQATVLYRSFLLKNAGGTLIAKVCVLYDITESKKLDEMRKAFVANASHELRSPAAGLQALVDALDVGGLEEPAQRKKFLGMMKREITRLNAIIGDLLDLSELEREKEFLKRPLHLVHLFQDWLSSYQTQLQEKNIEVRRAFAQPDITLLGSMPDLEKLFRNLLENAMKYTPEGGVIEIGLSSSDGNILGWVRDTGLGIPAEHLDRIFERFYRVDKSRSRALGGTGLGLSIAKHSVERHGGKIWVESEEGKGSTFWFKIPEGTTPS